MSLRPAIAGQLPSRRWPASLAARVGLRATLCLPYLALAGWAAACGVRSPVELALERHAEQIRWSQGLTWIGHAYPPVPSVLAELPGGPLTLGLLGGLLAGGVLHLAWQHLVRLEVPGWLVAVLLVTLGATPAFCYNATQDFTGFVGLALFALALAGLLDFTLAQRTTGGFVAGICLALAVLCDPSALLYTAGVLLASPLLAWRRSRLAPGAIRSTAAVLVFPTVALAGAWLFLQWRYTGHLYRLGEIAPGFLHFPGGAAASLRHDLAGLGLGLALSPLFLVSALLLARRRPAGFLALLLVPTEVLFTSWLGLHASTSQGLVLLQLAALLALPRRPGRWTALLVATAAAVQVLLWLTVLGSLGGVGAWLTAIGA